MCNNRKKGQNEQEKKNKRLKIRLKTLKTDSQEQE